MPFSVGGVSLRRAFRKRYGAACKISGQYKMFLRCAHHSHLENNYCAIGAASHTVAYILTAVVRNNQLSVQNNINFHMMSENILCMLNAAHSQAFIFDGSAWLRQI
jgi:hypothetical protein